MSNFGVVTSFLFQALKRRGREYWKAVHSFNLEGAYVNFMMDDEAEGVFRRPTATTTNFSRL